MNVLVEECDREWSRRSWIHGYLDMKKEEREEREERKRRRKKRKRRKRKKKKKKIFP